ncbi:amino acid ABC transporter ATP-binding protein [Catenulispora rubra]|uniref:amino acid ABC transporter ATP-binding protein n=1 Tax=Catenulispora rubra TaxID=280293 RepID=UPI0018924656|nr:amino acid ABC transporter ATP-binding protein [Catenulispora rubra]
MTATKPQDGITVSADQDDPAVIRVGNLTKSFEGRPVLRGIDLRVDRGSIVSVIGRSGGGKTTLLRCMNLLERPDGGTISISGEPVFADGRQVHGDLARLRQRVGMVFQRFNLFPHLTAIENVVIGQRCAKVAEREALERAAALLKRVGLAHRGLAYPDQMSGGEQQRVAIARALALRPEVLLFDEPTSSLDPEATREVLRVMRELAAEGMTMVLVTHEISFAREVADWTVYVDDGVVVEQGPPSEVLDRPAHERTRRFLTSLDTLD